jgi:hypothetical protein
MQVISDLEFIALGFSCTTHITLWEIKHKESFPFASYCVCFGLIRFLAMELISARFGKIAKEDLSRGFRHPKLMIWTLGVQPQFEFLRIRLYASDGFTQQETT